MTQQQFPRPIPTKQHFIEVSGQSVVASTNRPSCLLVLLVGCAVLAAGLIPAIILNFVVSTPTTTVCKCSFENDVI